MVELSNFILNHLVSEKIANIITHPIEFTVKGVVTCRPRNSCGFGGSFRKISITLDKYLMQDSNKYHPREQAESYTLVQAHTWPSYQVVEQNPWFMTFWTTLPVHFLSTGPSPLIKRTTEAFSILPIM